MATGKQPRMVTACTMLKRMLFRYQGNVSAALVLGGVDCDGPSLFMVYPHGSTDKLPYGTMGSGSLAAMAIFESQYKSGMNVEEAKALVHAASTPCRSVTACLSRLRGCGVARRALPPYLPPFARSVHSHGRHQQRSGLWRLCGHDGD